MQVNLLKSPSPSVTGTLSIAATSCESKTLLPSSLPRWLLSHLIKINQRQSEAEAHDSDKFGCFGLHDSVTYIQCDWMFQNLMSYVLYIHTLTQARQNLFPSSRHPVKAGWERATRPFPMNKCDCYGFFLKLRIHDDIYHRPRFKFKTKERDISIMYILLCSVLYDQVERDA